MAFSISKINRFFCCLSLETGAKIIGFTQVIISLILFIFDARDSIYFYKLLNSGAHYYIQAHLELTDVGISLFLIFGLYLLYGTYERKPSFIMAWVIFGLAFLMLLLMVFCMVMWHILRKGTDLHFLGVVIVSIGLGIYLNLIAFNFHYELKQKREFIVERKYSKDNSSNEEFN